MNRSRITVVGSANVDLTFRTSRLPLPGETLAGQSLHQGMGGKGANQAVVAARLGADVSFIAKVGDDGFGQQALDAYTADGIDVSFVQREPDCPTGTAAIMVDDDAENCIIVVAGANAKLTADDVQSARAAIEQSDAVLCQLETPVEAAIKAFRIARAAGVRTVLTPAPAKLVTDELLSLCDVCVPNRTEIAEMVGQPVRSDADASSAAESLRKRGVKQVALTLGGDGVLVLDDSGIQHVASHKVDAVDTTGAGDSFTGALAVSLSEGLSLVEAARKASIVAAISVTRMGTQTSFPTQKEIQQWFVN
ncbi:ribokinase [Rhodopirellula halodulae]|uniref:ribokinase n=1 Tax=Rhodopirellula halodulae TaxID=2894198 RepID=UPI001E5C5C72|nr:ribokinase [Rhodopirellula sp. JC737]MCC9654295.1 ribokinase [Rhodopirellula sp. JC737]